MNGSKRPGVTFRPIATGLDAVLEVVLPRSWFVKHIIRTLKRAKMFASQIELSDGSEWDMDGDQLAPFRPEFGNEKLKVVRAVYGKEKS